MLADTPRANYDDRWHCVCVPVSEHADTDWSVSVCYLHLLHRRTVTMWRQTKAYLQTRHKGREGGVVAFRNADPSVSVRISVCLPNLAPPPDASCPPEKPNYWQHDPPSHNQHPVTPRPVATPYPRPPPFHHHYPIACCIHYQRTIYKPPAIMKALDETNKISRQWAGTG